MKSPCVNICRIDSTGSHCLGCGRSLEEIAAWSDAPDAEKTAIIDRAQRRLDAPQSRPEPGAPRR